MRVGEESPSRKGGSTFEVGRLNPSQEIMSGLASKNPCTE